MKSNTYCNGLTSAIQNIIIFERIRSGRRGQFINGWALFILMIKAVAGQAGEEPSVYPEFSLSVLTLSVSGRLGILQSV